MAKKNTTAPATATPATSAPMVKIMTAGSLLNMFSDARTADPAKSAVEIIDELNARSKASAVLFVVSAPAIDWFAVMQGITYPVLTGDDADPTARKVLKVSDFLALKANAKSAKKAIDGALYALLEMFGANLCTEFHQTRKQDTATDILWLSRYTSDLDCFKAETRTSVNNMEKQLQVICNTLFGADNAPRIRKAHVRHLSDRFNKATRYNAEKGTGYTNGNAISLLQEILYHANDAHNGVNAYGVNGRLEAQRTK